MKQGGGWCWDSHSCQMRILQYSVTRRDLVSSHHWPTSKRFQAGVLHMAGTEWEAAHLGMYYGRYQPAAKSIVGCWLL